MPGCTIPLIILKKSMFRKKCNHFGINRTVKILNASILALNSILFNVVILSSLNGKIVKSLKINQDYL